MSDGSFDVVMVSSDTNYPTEAPFHPHEAYPEYPFQSSREPIVHSEPTAITSNTNHAYASVRQVLRELRLDAKNFGTSRWNPLGDLAQPGQTILLKPNWVTHQVHGNAKAADHILDCLITHTSVVRALMDYAFIAVGPTGRIVVADAPIQNADFALLMRRSEMDRVAEFYAARCPASVRILDLRREGAMFASDGRFVEKLDLDGDPEGYVRVDLKSSSALAGIDDSSRLYRSINYDKQETVSTHDGGTHAYLVARSILLADCVINVPKLKTHIKTGLTGALKNLVGINGNKAFLPHYRVGAPEDRGDEYPIQNRLLRWKSEYRFQLMRYPRFIREPVRRTGNLLLALSRFRKPAERVAGADPYLVTGGNWFGNDTAWRMVIDLNLIMRHADANGVVQPNTQRRVLTILDAISGGEGDGPLSPSPRKVGRMLGGFDSVAMDVLCARLLGFDWRKLALLRDGAKLLRSPRPLDEIRIRTADGMRKLSDVESFSFKAPTGWRGHVELARSAHAVEKTHHP